ncbi:hypothetical protein MGG_17544 [Pyricularia oryzae 70-15]|uniref:Uncharacterized protein n=1 Tax=Pyricularia oryzae (strain 70-15 / ATCC MYA-4617 / FGSC 8958) TaxID=242507 RepID=G4NEU5_PYRO7|nr:uncharacterized protein MGG_17544 [Pyricularia oryzae 70-15]EHA49518.1 hypothetical protein MGG_17544 [Pyricularia oryzae 70-15]
MRSGFLIAALCTAGAVADTELSSPKIARRSSLFAVAFQVLAAGLATRYES